MLECQVFVDRAWGVLVDALYSDDPRRRLWAADKILSSHVARDHPFSPANRRDPAREEGKQVISISWAGEADIVERGDSHLEAATPPPIEPAPAPEPTLPVWPGPHPPPLLVAHLYAPYTSPRVAPARPRR